MRIGRLAAIWGIAGVVFAGCGGDDDTPASATATATATRVHSVTPPPATATSTVPPPTSTEARSTSTPAPSATSTATATIDSNAPGRCTEAVECNPTSFSVGRSQEGCCDLALQLGGLPFSWCPATAIDPQTGECSRCVAHPCQGLPSRTPTSTFPATATEDPSTRTPTPTQTPTITLTPEPGRCMRDDACADDAVFSSGTLRDCCDVARRHPDLSFSWCPLRGIEEDTGHCSICRTDPCEGVPTVTSTPTETGTPTVTATLSADDLRIQQVIELAADSCPPPDAVGPTLTIFCSTRDCTFECRFQSGHYGEARLRRFASAAEAASAFDAYAGDHTRAAFHEWTGTFWKGEFVYPNIPDGSSHGGAFLANCWLATAFAYDDTHFLLGPQPSESLELVYQHATTAGLFDDCTEP